MNILLRRLIAAACALVCTLAFAADPKAPLTVEDAARLAQEWLARVDAGEYAQSWKEAAARFKASVSEGKWVNAMSQVRQPLGSVSVRELVESAATSEVPRAPKGNYWQVKFKTKFEAVAAHEIVTLTEEPDGAWRVVSFFIRPAS